MKRREFIKKSSLISVIPILLNQQALFAFQSDFLLESLTSLRPDRKLILIQLNGGNDGLNTFIPLDQYSNLQKARANIIIPEKDLLSFTETIGIHPSFKDIKTLFDEERLLLIQNVAYPNPNLSHFRSKDIVCTASDSDVVLQSGWIGRMLSGIHPDFPQGYPNENTPHPIALTIGSTSSQTCQGLVSNFSSVITNLKTTYTSPDGDESFPETPFGNELKYVSTVMEQTEIYLEAISEAASKASNLSGLYPDSGNTLSDQLKIVARLIAGGLQTQIYVLSVGGWDTHADQVTEGTPLEGKHSVLLKSLSEALYAFQDDIKLLGIEDDVLGMVFTEFGRRIKSNNSFGTDHGTAWPAILFGSLVNPIVLGSNPVISENVEKQDNLSMQFDIRSVYGSIFREWFEADYESIRQVLFDDFEHLPILKKDTTGKPEMIIVPEITIFPNPVSHEATLSISFTEDPYELLLYSSKGDLIKKIKNRSVQVESEFSYDFSELSSGAYVIVLISKRIRKSISIIKL
ncbi:MAG: DUF1501 domain-containing protein [Bacteroidales bacterium]|nr:DUF1501 domain-containing protein [Bacteroidales bacterium]MCF8392067.1 DUF1501 domain-containing protein [Bacteroidales bacterium]